MNASTVKDNKTHTHTVELCCLIIKEIIVNVCHLSHRVCVPLTPGRVLLLSSDPISSHHIQQNQTLCSLKITKNQKDEDKIMNTIINKEISTKINTKMIKKNEYIRRNGDPISKIK